MSNDHISLLRALRLFQIEGYRTVAKRWNSDEQKFERVWNEIEQHDPDGFCFDDGGPRKTGDVLARLDYGTPYELLRLWCEADGVMDFERVFCDVTARKWTRRETLSIFPAHYVGRYFHKSKDEIFCIRVNDESQLEEVVVGHPKANCNELEIDRSCLLQFLQTHFRPDKFEFIFVEAAGLEALDSLDDRGGRIAEPDPMPEQHLSIDLARQCVVVDGNSRDVTVTQLAIVAQLLGADGAWIQGPQLGNSPTSRVDKHIRKMPADIRAQIESGRDGYRIRRRPSKARHSSI